MANAFALPGGHIVLLSGLINQSRNPEELAGVLAHEMGHSIEKDPEALFIRSSDAESFLELLTGQEGDDVASSFSALLLQIRYSQEAELKADHHAVDILRKAQVSPRAIGEFLLRHAVGSRPHGGGLQYLGSHPWFGDRANSFLLRLNMRRSRSLAIKNGPMHAQFAASSAPRKFT